MCKDIVRHDDSEKTVLYVLLPRECIEFISFIVYKFASNTIQRDTNA